MKHEYSAGIVVYHEEEEVRKYLILLYHPNYWGLSKGRMEAGETKLQAAKRELKEETGLEAEVHPGFELSHFYQYKDKSHQLVRKEVTFFVGKAIDTQVTLSYEHQGYKWLTLHEAVMYLTYEKDRETVSKADQFLENHKL